MDKSIIAPVFVQAGLTFALMFWMGYERYRAIREGSVKILDPGVRPVWRGRAGVVSNAFHNQLEMPMLFYVAVALALITNSADFEMTALAWAFAGLRLVHAAIHTTYNTVLHRFVAYLVSNVALLAMWINLALWTLLGW